MKLTFIGAAHEVTGSCHYLESAGRHMLVDCGMEQGPDVYENQELPVVAAAIDYCFLTHAHIDHSGLLPLLYARGFRGPIYTTAATADLCRIMLKDSAHIQQFEAEWRNRKAKRAGQEEYVPMYSIEDAVNVCDQLVPCEYDEIVEVADGIRLRFSDVGHLLGSASIEVWLQEGETSRKIVFSGDIGNENQPLIRDPQYLKEADYVVMESTYGDRSHGERIDYAAELARILRETFDRGGNLVIPCFAVGRTQEMLYFFRQIKQMELVPEYQDFEVYVDSPLAIEATTIFKKNIYRCFDEEALSLVQQGINPIGFDGLRTAVTSDESRAINFDPKPKVIISASGMCEAGRIRHHLKHNLWRDNSTILFVGYQAVGTLGRALLEGVTQVKLFGENIHVEARICKLEGISGHADREGLIRWLEAFEKKPEQVFVVHGDDHVTERFAAMLEQDYGYRAEAPFSGSSYDLGAGRWIVKCQGVVKERKQSPSARAESVYNRLLNAGERLQAVIGRNKGCSNKELARFADQIQALCDKWDR